MNTEKKTDVYEIINEQILALLEAGTNPWRKPWHAAAQLPPQNLMSRKAYRGLNVLLLGLSPFESPYWLTFNQARAAGGNVKKGEKSRLVTFWKMFQADDRTTGEKKNVPMLRYYRVFNADQCEGVATPKLEVPSFEHNPIDAAERIAAAMPNAPQIATEDTRQAYYSPKKDVVNMPPRDRFETAEGFYEVLFHELTHSTGHASRLGRDLSGTFGETAYGREELIAEMGSAYLCGLAGITESTITNAAAYLDSWRKVIKEDKRAVVVAAGAAQRAVDFITGATAEETTTTEEE